MTILQCQQKYSALQTGKHETTQSVEIRIHLPSRPRQVTSDLHLGILENNHKCQDS